jgi:hypothetical protein
VSPVNEVDNEPLPGGRGFEMQGYYSHPGRACRSPTGSEEEKPMKKRPVVAALLSVPLLVASGAVRLGAEDVDLATVHRIKAEAFQGSKVMDHLFWLTDVNGPRLTGSPGFQAAADWAVRNLEEWGATGVRLEKWGTFGRGWSMSRFSAHMIAPAYSPLPGVPKAWSGATNGPVTGEAVYAPLVPKDESALPTDVEKLAARIRQYAEKYKGKLRGKVVLITAPRELDPPTEPASRRYDDSRLTSIAAAPEPFAAPPLEWPITKLPADPKELERFWASVPLEMSADYWQRQERVKNGLNAFLEEEGCWRSWAPTSAATAGSCSRRTGAPGSRARPCPLRSSPSPPSPTTAWSASRGRTCT